MASLANLSKGGVFIRSTEPIAPGMAMAGRFTIPGHGRSYAVAFRGEVTWTTQPGHVYGTGPGFGVRFTRVTSLELPRTKPPLRRLRTPESTAYKMKAIARQMAPGLTAPVTELRLEAL